jgi:hypothetical protein
MRQAYVYLIKVYMKTFWDIALCSLIEEDRRFRYAYCLPHCGD